MRSRAIRTLMVLLLPSGLLAGCMSATARLSRAILESRGSSSSLAFTNVQVLSLSGPGVLDDQTVLVEDGLIAAVGEASRIVIREGTQVVDARGKYLMPGLIDMHVHISDQTDLPLLLLHGVTTVRNMADLPGWVKKVIGFPDVLALRRRIRARDLLGPDIYTAGPALDGSPPVSPFNKVVRSDKDARREIAQLRSAGYDYVKIYDRLSSAAFDSVLVYSRESGLPVVGHVPLPVGLERVLQSPVLSIEHLTGYIDNNRADFIIRPDELGEWAERTRKAGIYNCPTLVIWDRLPAPGALEQLSRYPEFALTSRRIRWLWGKTLKTVYEVDYSPKQAYPGHMMDISRKMLKELYQKGCRLLVGTDMNFVGVFPGASTLREIELLVETGVSPLDALRAATVNAAEFLGRADQFGSIAAGQRADLVLLNRNPLSDIRNIRDIAGVMVRGLWLDAEARGQIKDALAAGLYRRPEVKR